MRGAVLIEPLSTDDRRYANAFSGGSRHWSIACSDTQPRPEAARSTARRPAVETSGAPNEALFMSKPGGPSWSAAGRSALGLAVL